MKSCVNRSLQEGAVCHGEFNQHNILFSEGKVRAVTNFDKWNFDIQVGDLYRFMRKIPGKTSVGSGSGKKAPSGLPAGTASFPGRGGKISGSGLLIRRNTGNWQTIIIPTIRPGFRRENLEKLEKLREQKDKWRNFVESVFCGLRNFRICLTNHRKHGINNCRPQ